MTNENEPEWIAPKPDETKAESALVVVGAVPKPKEGRRTRKSLDEAAADLDPSNPIILARLDLVRQLWGDGRVKSTILAALQQGIKRNPDKGVYVEAPPLKSASQAYTYYHRFYQDIQEDLHKSQHQKNAEARARLMALARSAERAGNHGVAAQIYDRVALIDKTPNPITAVKTLFMPQPPGGDQAPPPQVFDLDRAGLQSIILTGRLPAPKTA